MLRLLIISLILSVSNAKISEKDAHISTLIPQHDVYSCAPEQTILQAAQAASINLTPDEIDTLKHLCLHPQHLLSATNTTLAEDHNAIPPGVSCTSTNWCDSGTCSQVCARGSVNIDPWMDNAIRLQSRLARSLPFCYSTWFGTHNSAISIADGYGNLDPVFQSLFKYIKWAAGDFRSAILRTNNQWLSLTDQMNLGVRVIEIDTHWVGGVLRVAHCGGLHLDTFNFVVKMLNTLAKLLGHHIRWDTETLGCDPSLSSIPTMLQRTVKDAFIEIKEWMDDEKNKDEFLVLFFDDQPNLETWGVVEKLKKDILDIFSRDLIFTQEDLHTYTQKNNNNSNNNNNLEWPSANEMRKSGRRLLLVSATDYGMSMAPLIFPRGQIVCNWSEPSLEKVDGIPDCILHSSKLSSSSSSDSNNINNDIPNNNNAPSNTQDLFHGDIIRVSTCELEYGPLNCEFIWRGGNRPTLDETSLPEVTSCGLNIPSPDLLTTSRAASAVWTWAPGHPFFHHTNDTASSNIENTPNTMNDGDIEKCALLSASDGRWRAVSCALQGLPYACRLKNVTLQSTHQWVLHHTLTATINNTNIDNKRDGMMMKEKINDDDESMKCPDGTVFDVPRHPRESFLLAQAVRDAGADGAWLPVYAPEWEVEGIE